MAGIISTRPSAAELAAAIGTHAALATGVHGGGADVIATDADIATHAGLATVHQDAPNLISNHAALDTGVHGAGGDDLAVLADISGAIVWLNTSIKVLDIDSDSPAIGYTTLDLGALAGLPADATEVILEVRFKVNTTGSSGSSHIFIRRNGDGDTIDALSFDIDDSDSDGTTRRGAMIIGLDANQIIEYSIAEATSAAGFAIDIVVKGYRKGSAV